MYLDRGEMTVLIFTDGAFEKGIATIGGVLFDPLDGALGCFGGQVGPEIAAHRYRASLGQAEILPATIARIIWRNRLLGRRNIDSSTMTLPEKAWFTAVPEAMRLQNSVRLVLGS